MWLWWPKLDPWLRPSLVNSHRFDSEVKLPSVGICFLSAEKNMDWPRLGPGIGGERIKWDLGLSHPHTRTVTHLKVCHLDLLCPGSLTCCLNHGTVVIFEGCCCWLKSQNNLGESLSAGERARSETTTVWFTGFQCGSTNSSHHKQSQYHSLKH